MSNSVFGNLLPKLRQHLQRNGVKSTVLRIINYARQRAYLDETHVWYELTLGTARPRRELPSGFVLLRGTPEHLPLLEQLPTVLEAEARSRMEAGADLWLVLENQTAAFACWIFHSSTPVLAAPNGRLKLPPEIVCLEDSVTSAAYRGRSIAPAAWSRIADDLETTEIRSIITKIEESNIASRRAVSKVGFQEIATMHFRRVGPSRRTTVKAGSGMAADWLVEHLQR